MPVEVEEPDIRNRHVPGSENFWERWSPPPDPHDKEPLAGPIGRWPTGVESLHQIDWKNLDYPFHAGEEEWTHLENGSGTSVDHNYWLDLRGVVFGDLTGDGVEEAVIRLREYDGGSMGIHYMWSEIITLVGKRPIILETLLDGDVGSLAGGRHRGATLDVQIAKGQLIRCISIRPDSSMGLAKDGPGPPWFLQHWHWNAATGHMDMESSRKSTCGRGKSW
jgi:hypothetical protein